MNIRKKVPTILDVADLAQVSISTVSRVMNNPEKVNLDTRQKVYKAIDSLEFVPQAEARARALHGKGRIGVITPFFTAPSFVQRLRGIAATLSKENFDLIIYTVDSNNRLQSFLTTLPLTGNLDGLVIVSLPVADADVDRLLKNNLPTVLIEFPHPLLNSVEIDDVKGGTMAAEYLINKGHKRIAFLGDTDLPEYSLHPVSLRLKGFRRALSAAKLEIPQGFVRLAPYNQEQAQIIAKELLAGTDSPTAIFAATDLQALGVIKAARKLNVKVPVRQHLDESGRIAIEILLSHIADPSRPVQHITLPLNLVERLTA
jgi:DNA-binding LacI/PurR family transcriptional regulator